MQFQTQVIPIYSLQDNYIWAIDFPLVKKCIIVDPGEYNPVLHHLENTRYVLSDIFITHSHADHTNGVKKLIDMFPDVKIWGPKKENIERQTHFLQEKSTIPFLGIENFFEVYEIPGHTKGHIAYYSKYLQKKPVVFCGDTLFSAGCGRVLGGTVQELYTSLMRLRSLPSNTLFYPSHEYTLSNLRFAKWLHADALILDKLKQTVFLRKRNQPTLPCYLTEERLINPFLKCDDVKFTKIIEKRFKIEGMSASALFAVLRKMKDTWYDTENIF